MFYIGNYGRMMNSDRMAVMSYHELSAVRVWVCLYAYYRANRTDVGARTSYRTQVLARVSQLTGRRAVEYTGIRYTQYIVARRSAVVAAGESICNGYNRNRTASGYERKQTRILDPVPNKHRTTALFCK